MPGTDALDVIQEDEIESGTSSSGGGGGDAESFAPSPSWQPNMYQRPSATPQNRFIHPPVPPANPWQNTGSQLPATNPPPVVMRMEMVQPTEISYSELSFVSLIGEGGFGKVWLAEFQGSKVAVKVAVPKPGIESTMLKEFQREVATMSSVPPHENIIRLRGVCTQPPHLALISDYCPKGSLYQALHTPGSPGPTKREMLTMWLGIARGMTHLHQHSILHRDLKSANLLLDDSWQIRICDFGLSRICQSGSQQAQVMTGVLGTYQWMAPEVLMSQRYTERADVFSFAIVMWECLTRRLPYSGMTAMAAGFKVATQGLRPDIPYGVDHSISSLIRQCWAAVPDQRPSFSSIVTRLEGIVQAMDYPMMAPRLPGAEEIASATCHVTAQRRPGLPLAPPKIIPPPPPLAHPVNIYHHHPQQQKESNCRPLTSRQGISLWGGRGKSDTLPI